MLVGLALLGGSVASQAAQAGEGGDSAQLTEAKALLNLGADAYNKGDFQSAWLHFVHAHELFPSPKIYFNIGQALLRLNRRAEAAEAFDVFLTSTATDAKTDFSKKQEASNSLSKLAKDLAKVTLEVTPESARVQVDDRKVVPGPVYLLLDPSEHVFVATADGFQPIRETVVTNAAGKTNIVVRIHLVGAPTVVAPVIALLPPSTGPVATPTPSTPTSALPVVRPETAPTAAPTDVPKAADPAPTTKMLLAQTPIDAPPTATAPTATASSTEPSRLPAYVAWGAGAVLAGVGTYFGIKALNLGNTIGTGNGGIGQCDNSQTAGYDAANCPNWHHDALAADLLFAGAIAAGATGGVLFVVAPNLVGGGGEVGVVGRF